VSAVVDSSTVEYPVVAAVADEVASAAVVPALEYPAVAAVEVASAAVVPTLEYPAKDETSAVEVDSAVAVSTVVDAVPEVAVVATSSVEVASAAVD
jgi:hypothetical protein